MEGETAPSPPPISEESNQNEIICDTNKNANTTTNSHVIFDSLIVVVRAM